MTERAVADRCHASAGLLRLGGGLLLLGVRRLARRPGPVGPVGCLRVDRWTAAPGPAGTPVDSRPGPPARAEAHCAGPEAAGAVAGSGLRSQPTLIPL